MKKYSILIGWEQCRSSVTPVQKVKHQCNVHVVILDYDWQKTIRNFVGQWYHVKEWQKICMETLKNVFSYAKKMASRNVFWDFSGANYFMFVLLISNHTVFSFNLKLICRAEAARAISAFWKTHSCKLIPNWTRKNRMITYTYHAI